MDINYLIKNHFEGSLLLYLSKRVNFDNFTLYLSDDIDDNYWNLASNLKVNDVNSFKDDWQDIKREMLKYNREPAVLLPNNEVFNPDSMKKIGLAPIYQDCWLIVENINDFPVYKSELELDVLIVDENTKYDFVEAVINGFSGDNTNDPYSSLPDGYRITLTKSFNKTNNEFKLYQYLVKYNDIAVGTASMIVGKDIALIYNITTNKNYKRKKISKELVSYLIHSLNENVKIVCLQTEKGYYTETVYKNMGFKEKFTSYAYKEVK